MTRQQTIHHSIENYLCSLVLLKELGDDISQIQSFEEYLKSSVDCSVSELKSAEQYYIKRKKELKLV